MSEMVDRVAVVIAKARGCFDLDSAMAQTGFPCPFCLWDEEAKEESGCQFWAEQIIALMREPTLPMVEAPYKNRKRPEVGDDEINRMIWRFMCDEALK